MAHHQDLTSQPSVAVTEVTDGLAYELGDVRVSCAPVHHFPVDSAIGYRVEAEGKAVVIARRHPPVRQPRPALLRCRCLRTDCRAH
jgi:hypothetical protein